MTDTQTPEVTAPVGADLVETAGVLGANLARTGATLMSLPLYFLPPTVRKDAFAATNELITTVGKFHLSLFKVVVGGIDSATHEINKFVIEPQPVPVTVETPKR
ncbi:MAG: hypothetical protein HC822_15750 [Oscillochloris sp.]|nr:hypothetical protein [Oscillochloris sp.]